MMPRSDDRDVDVPDAAEWVVDETAVGGVLGRVGAGLGAFSLIVHDEAKVEARHARRALDHR
jgi:hypothetical protein